MGNTLAGFNSLGNTPCLIDSESTWHNGLTYYLEHCFIIEASNSSKPDEEFFIVEIIFNILSSVISIVLMPWTLFVIYFNGAMSDFIFSARFLPTLTKKSLNEFAIVNEFAIIII